MIVNNISGRKLIKSEVKILEKRKIIEKKKNFVEKLKNNVCEKIFFMKGKSKLVTK